MVILYHSLYRVLFYSTGPYRELLQSSTYLLIVTHQAVMRYKGHTLELLDYLDFTGRCQLCYHGNVFGMSYGLLMPMIY